MSLTVRCGAARLGHTAAEQSASSSLVHGLALSAGERRPEAGAGGPGRPRPRLMAAHGTTLAPPHQLRVSGLSSVHFSLGFTLPLHLVPLHLSLPHHWMNDEHRSDWTTIEATYDTTMRRQRLSSSSRCTRKPTCAVHQRVRDLAVVRTVARAAAGGSKASDQAASRAHLAAVLVVALHVPRHALGADAAGEAADARGLHAHHHVVAPLLTPAPTTQMVVDHVARDGKPQSAVIWRLCVPAGHTRRPWPGMRSWAPRPRTRLGPSRCHARPAREGGAKRGQQQGKAPSGCQMRPTGGSCTQAPVGRRPHLAPHGVGHLRSSEGTGVDPPAIEGGGGKGRRPTRALLRREVDAHAGPTHVVQPGTCLVSVHLAPLMTGQPVWLACASCGRDEQEWSWHTRTWRDWDASE